LVDPGAIRTISFGSDAGTFVSRVTAAAHRNTWNADAGAPQPKNVSTLRSSGRPTPIVPELGVDERPTPPAKKPPGPPPVRASGARSAASSPPQGSLRYGGSQRGGPGGG
jgi:hypothetical protein